MKVLKKGNGVDQNWSLKVTCTGKGWLNKLNPCYSELELNNKDVVARNHMTYGDVSPTTYYGFFCPVCHCFTEVDEKLIPASVKQNCMQVAKKGSNEYEKLTVEEQKLSDKYL